MDLSSAKSEPGSEHLPDLAAEMRVDLFQDEDSSLTDGTKFCEITYLGKKVWGLMEAELA